MGKVKVGVLGATGSVGQRFIQLLEGHEYFEVVALGASDKSAGNLYKDVMKSRWKVSSKIPDYAANMKITRCTPKETPNVDQFLKGDDFYRMAVGLHLGIEN